MSHEANSPENQEFISATELLAFARLMERKYAGSLKARRFEVKATLDRIGVYATITLRNESGSFFYPVETRLTHRDNELSVRDSGLMLLDYIDSYFEEYFREGDVFLPIDWSDYEFEGVPFQIKGQVLNLEAESLADEWLRAGGAEVNESEGDPRH